MYKVKPRFTPALFTSPQLEVHIDYLLPDDIVFVIQEVTETKPYSKVLSKLGVGYVLRKAIDLIET